MCDTLKKKDLPDNEKPQYVYKRVQKVGEGKYVSPVMGETLILNSWKKAPKRPELEDKTWTDLVDLIKRPYKRADYTSSSVYATHHDGMWGSFKNKIDAERVDLISNFVSAGKKGKKVFPPIVVKCEVKGTVHQTDFQGYPTFLVEQLKVVEEVGKATDC